VKTLPNTRSIPQEVLEHSLDYARALGVIDRWEAYVPHDSPRWFSVYFPDGHVSVWTPGFVAAFCLGVRLTIEREEP